MPKILIIDDETLTVNLLETFLRAKGFEVTSATNGRDGVALALLEPPDVIILDMMLPDMSGDMVCGFLRENLVTAQMPILMLSALSARTTQDKAKTAGATMFLNKNTPLQELLKHIRHALEPTEAPPSEPRDVL